MNQEHLHKLWRRLLASPAIRRHADRIISKWQFWAIEHCLYGNWLPRR